MKTVVQISAAAETSLEDNKKLANGEVHQVCVGAWDWATGTAVTAASHVVTAEAGEGV